MRQGGNIRAKATAARTRRALNIAPHTSFLSNPASSIKPSSSPSTHIIFNPPSSAPTVYHTPFKFLPKNDPRRRAELPSNIFGQSTTVQYNSVVSELTAATTRQATQPQAEPSKLPTVGHAGPKKHHLTPQDVEEMRRLRYADPEANSISVLAKKFGCSKLFVIFCCPPTEEQKKKMREQAERIQARWGPRKSAAIAERQRRREMLLAGEI